MLSISAGSDPRYLTKEVGQGAEHYYLRSIGEAGEPPGYWLGEGLDELGLSGEVQNEVFEDLYTHWIDPRKRDEMYVKLEAIPHEEGTEEYAKAEKKIRKAATLGNAPKTYEKAYEKRLEAAMEKARAAAPRGELSPEQVKSIEFSVRKEAPSATLYYDLTFSAPKSWSVYHASLQVKAMEAREAGDAETAAEYTRKAEQVWDCWKEGVQAGLQHMQEEAGYSRAGHHGQAVEGRASGRYVDAHEFVVAGFAQHTSRNDDPQLHVHTAVLAKVKTVDVDAVTGQEKTVWRSLDGRGLFKHKQAAGHIAELVGNEALERVMGVRVEMRPDGKAREIVGISQEKRDLHSSRRMGILEGVAELEKAYEEKNGVKPNAYVLARMSEYVTLDQRNAKKHDATTRDQLLQRWETATQDRFRESLADIPDQVADRSAVHQLHRPAKEFDPEVIQRRAIEAVQEAKPTWTRPDLIVELTKQLPDTLGGLEAHQVTDLLNKLADDALSPTADNGVVCTKAPALVEIPAELQRRDGTFVYEPNPATFDRYATEEHIRVEERLRQFAGERGAPTVPAELVEEVIERRGLKGAQADFVRSAATSGRKVDLLVGPAGAGKSYTLAALTEVWESHNDGKVIGLASGQRAAEVLKEEGIENVANIEMLLLKNKAIAEGKNVPDADKYRIPRGALVVLDENGMTDTTDINEIRKLVEASGAKTIPAGDPAQLPAVGAGGMFAQWVEEAPGVHFLDEVRRFRDVDPVTGEKVTRQWEADASLKLRTGDPEALEQYELRRRFRGGSAEEMTERAYQAWLTDHLDGKNPLLIASDNAQVAELSARVRADLVRAKRVSEDGVVLRTGREDHGIETKAGVGDLIQLRRNDRKITAENGDFAVNRTVAKVTGISDNGALMVQLEDGARMHLPAAYVKEHVELAYAATVHGAQGRTVGVCHSLVDETTSREALYVMLTRGEAGNFGYVITHRDDIKQEDIPDYLATLNSALQRSSLEKTATRTIEGELERREHLAVLEPVWSGVKDQQAEEKYGRALYQALGSEEYERLCSEESYGSLMRLARHVEEQGYDAEDLLVRTARSRELDSADDHAATLHWRLERAYEHAERTKVLAEEAEQRAALTEQRQKVDAAIEAAHEPVDPDELQQLVDETPHAELLKQTLANQEYLETLQRDTDEDGQAKQQDQMANAREAAEELTDADVQGLVLDVPAGPEEVNPHFEELMKQNDAFALNVDVLHAGQDNEVAQRQAAEREAQWEATDSYASRTPTLPGDLGRFMDEWATEMDQRVERLGQRVAEQEPQWAIERLGPVPEDPIDRADWELRAGRVERYREAHGHDDERSAIGQAPPRGSVEARADWERARRALGVDEREADIARASDETLNKMVERGEREEDWAPPYVADQMQQAFAAQRDFADQATQMELRAQEMAEKETAAHEERVNQAMYEVSKATGYNEHQQALAQSMALQQVPTLQAEIDPSDLVKDTLDRAETSRNIAETMGDRALKYQEVQQAREQWVEETQTIRDEADLARTELERRAPEPTVAETAATAPEPEDDSLTAIYDREYLERAIEQARQAEGILAERVQEREQAAERQREAERQSQAEEIDRERRDTGIDFEAEYERLGQELAGHDQDMNSSAPSSPAAPAPEIAAPEPEPIAVPAPEPPPSMPDLDTDIDM
ncbi:MobF family relaxase [Streptomyces rugosispiralis]|uniref:AAA family ATPase n=1 Tax=Streptomyces rugosispiralis TaxID=2967341 RepID=A0ABT1VCI8_9ACTN|nr:MobF family relaxase [Streptomyces rugosispiralis]MCQ8194683.1 AAA family ATPase [Streptomyces rugosispiralis]